MTGSMLDLALAYAAEGLAVFPCREKPGDPPDTPPDRQKFRVKAPYHNQVLGMVGGVKAATIDPERIRQWWGLWPNAMIGLAMGNGLFAADIDIKEHDGWDTLEAEGISLPPGTPRIRTLTGGQHAVFRQPGFKISNSAGKVGPGIDIRSDGGYIIAAGSVIYDHAGQAIGAYEWITGSSYRDAPDAPARLLELLRAPEREPKQPGEPRTDDPSALKWARAALNAECRIVAQQSAGGRNNQLNLSAMKVGQIVGGGYLELDTAIDALLIAAQAAGLVKDDGEAQCRKTINSGLKKGMADPRHPPDRPRDNGHDETGFTPDPELGDPPEGERAPPPGEESVRSSGTFTNRRARPEPEAQIEGPPLLSSADFMSGLRPPQWLIDGLLTSGFTYTLTGLTGTGKTALALLMAFNLVNGHGFAGRETERGSVAFFAGENADNVRIQWYALCKHWNVDPSNQQVFWFDQRFALKATREDITRKLALIDDLGLIVVDSLQAYFSGEDENSNVAMLDTAVELRRFTLEHARRPSGLILAHPVKNASKDNLLPRGGSSVTNELDGNMTLWRDDETEVIELGWAGKWRGPPFEPITFEIIQVQPEGLVSGKGKQMSCGVMAPISTAAVAEKRERMLSDDEIVLTAIRSNSEITLDQLAQVLGKKSRSSGMRARDRLLKQQLIKRKGRGYILTKAGIAILDGEE